MALAHVDPLPHPHHGLVVSTAVAACRQGNLPADTTSFIGRKNDVAEVKRLLAKARLVTLTGVGGVGKTRLALRAGASLHRAFADGVWFVELAGLHNGELVAHTTLEALGVRNDTGRSQTAVLTEYLRDRQVLLILDNCEHVVDACAELADVLLRAAPGLRVLATSRERLGLGCEHLWPVPPLPLPDPQQSMPAGAWLQYPALTLFGERATAVQPNFTLANENQAQVAQVCRVLGGVPLGIELAAVQLRVLTLDRLLSGLADCFRSLNLRTRGGLPRHQTLRAAVEWSFDLCTPAEQRLWARASVFAGSFDLSAAEQVCTSDDLAADEILTHVAGLVDKSVLISDRNRFWLLEPLRQCGRNKLRESGEETTVRRRHRDHYLDLAQSSEQEWFGPRQAEIFGSTRAEHANFRAALDFSLASPAETTAGLKLAGTLWFYWAGCGVLGEGRHWLDRALTLAPEPGPERAKALWVNGHISTLQGDTASAVSMLEECRTYAVAAGNGIALAYATHRLGCNALVGDDANHAKELFEAARTHYQRLNEMNSNVMLAGIELAIAAVFLGDLDRAASLCSEVDAIGLASGEQWAYAYAVYVRALVAFSRGDLDQAITYGNDCLRIKQKFNDLLGIVLAIEILAWTSAARGEWKRAATMLGAAKRIWQSVGFPMFGSKYFGAPHRECEEQTRQALGTQAFEAILNRSATFTLEEAITYTLGDNKGTDVPTTAKSSPQTLTTREQEVAALIATGLSNKAIAEKLVISPRTAEGHVNRILDKLGFDSRTQIATWITQTSGQTPSK